ncbi:Calcineurin-like phosphoesterase [Devosia crocina]|uniref:Calcineurin-like phosphoesterase n=1 Tax=Devosia crocina TaxID=429728 RepID=A0A1I7N6Q0_9HYPH|nr:metallophosphoesterase [Devosia crocina]SFV30236.1 Calcineurin-like phosphoesterase [Devosia crocina]
MIIAQLSDIHANGSSERLERLDAVVDWLMPMQPDILIVSGDLAEDDFSQSYRAVQKRLEGFGCPYFVVPGNVDNHAEMRDVFGRRFGWSRDWPLNVSGVVGDLRIIGLDVTVEGAHHGDAAPVLDWLADELRSEMLPTLIFQHQHPFPTGIDGKDRNVCFNGDALAEVIESAGDSVIGLTCGHVHRALFTRFAGRHATMAPSIKKANMLRLDGRESAVVDPPGLLLHHWSEGRLVSHVVMVG